MSSSSENDPISQLRYWSIANPVPKIKASFKSAGGALTIEASGRLVLDEEKGTASILDSSGKTPLIFVIASAKSISRHEPLVDAPDKFRFKMAFFIVVSFKLEVGVLDLFEVAD